MAFLQQGDSAAVTVPAGQSIRVGAYRNAWASVLIPLGLKGGPNATVSNTATNFGPFPTVTVVSVCASYGEIEYAVGGTPALSDALFNPASVAISGGTINGTALGATTPAIVKVSDLQVGTSTDISGTPGNGTSSGTTGKAAFPAAGSSVTVTSTLCTANSRVFVQLGGSDATLTSVRVTPAAGSFVVTGNTAATGITPFVFLLVN